MEKSKDRKGFVMYKDQHNIIKSLTDEQAGMLMKGIFEYQATGNEPEFEPLMAALFIAFKTTLDRDAEKFSEVCDRRASAGRKGGLKTQAKLKQNQVVLESDQANQAMLQSAQANQATLVSNQANQANSNSKSNSKSKSNSNKEKIYVESEDSPNEFNKHSEAESCSETKTSPKPTPVAKKPARKNPPPSLEDVVAFARQCAGDNNPWSFEEKARAAYKFYEGNMKTLGATTWKNSAGKTVLNWKLTLRNNWFKDIQVVSAPAKTQTF